MRRPMGIASIVLSLALHGAWAFTADPLVVHEWGTFTALQDENGDAIAGVNSDDEPLPRFTHNLALMLIIGTPVQGAPKCHPDVTLRLETPVVYFHRTKSAPAEADVRVRFNGGWLTQYYPDAEADAPGLRQGQFDFGRLTKDTVGELHWRRLRIGGAAVGPETNAHVWLAPRKVQADSVRTQKGESERFLFYRGVGHVDAPLRVSRLPGDPVQLRIAPPSDPAARSVLSIGPVWLLEVQEDGASAWRTVGSIGAPDGPPEQLTPASFPAEAFHDGNLARLRSDMRGALLAERLFADEADALLSTWELSYFKSPGLRLFFMVPRPWTDAVLPFEVSVPAHVERVMVGRIELVTPQQRDLLRRRAALPAPTSEDEAAAERAAIERKLGRFRDALILDDARRRLLAAPIAIP